MKIFTKAAIMGLGLLILAGCGRTTDTSDIELDPNEYQDFYTDVAEEYKKYVEIADYKGIEVPKVEDSDYDSFYTKKELVLYDKALDKIVEKSVFKKELPKKEFESLLKETKDFYGIQPDENNFSSELYANGEAAKYLKRKMVTTILAADNGVTVSEDDILEAGKVYIEYWQDSGDYDSLIEEYGKKFNATLGQQVLFKKVADIVAPDLIEK